MNVALWLQRSAAAHAERPALAHGTRVHATYAQFLDRAQRLASHLEREHGAAPGERIALYCANHPSYLEAMYAAWIAGAVVVPINAKLHAREAAFILEDSGALACFADVTSIASLRELAPGCAFLDIAAVDALLDAEPAPLQERRTDDLAWLFYTSGTTGRPKGVMLTHGNLVQATLAYLATVSPVGLGDALLHAAPQSHGSGLYNFAYVANAGINVVPESRGFDEAEVLRLASAYPGASMFAAPTMVKRIVAAAAQDRQGAEAIGTIVYGGGPMYVADIEAALAVMGNRFAQIYGQGESPMTITVLPKHVIADRAHPRHLERLASVGHPQMSVEVAVRDADGRELPAGDVGEVCVRGPTVMKGYWRKPEATEAAIRDGWLHTGDVGTMDEDGFLTLKDRSKDVIISGGSNIYPREVEEVLLLHPNVREVSVIGVPDPEWGESVLAFVVAGAVETSELDELCLQHIARFKRPRHYRFIDALPKSAYGKILKIELRKLV